MRVYVGNLSPAVTEQMLNSEFSFYGRVESVEIKRDRDLGISKGYAFLEMPIDSDAQAAIAGLNGRVLKQRALVVNNARPRTGFALPRG